MRPTSLPKTAILTLFLGGLACPALATEWLYCGNEPAEVEIGLLLGTTSFLSPVGATMRDGDAKWASDAAYGEGTVFTVAQGFADAETIRVDLYDDIMNERVAELRLFQVEEGEELTLGGTLRIIGQGAWPVACSPT